MDECAPDSSHPSDMCHNTYAYSLLFYKVCMKRENAGSWNYGLEKEKILETYSAQLQKS